LTRNVEAHLLRDKHFHCGKIRDNQIPEIKVQVFAFYTAHAVKSQGLSGALQGSRSTLLKTIIIPKPLNAVISPGYYQNRQNLF
jgi:hypothetical protein